MVDPALLDPSSSYRENTPLATPSIDALRSELAAADSKKRYIFRSATVTVSLAVVALLGGAALFFVAPAISVALLVGSTIFGIIGLVQFVRYVSCSDEAEKLRKKMPLTPEEKEKKEKENLELNLMIQIIMLRIKGEQLRVRSVLDEQTRLNIENMKNQTEFKFLSERYYRGIDELNASNTNEIRKHNLHELLTKIYEYTQNIDQLIQKLFTHPEDSFIQKLQFSLKPVPPLPIHAPPPQ